jgi:phage shock protein A
MALLERVSTLLRANLNDLVEKAEDPEKMLKQVILDMENQLMQVKTQVAIAIADQHLLEKKQQEQVQKTDEWSRKAELAVSKEQDDLARAALERSLSHKQMIDSYAQQVADQKVEVENLKTALRKLEQKLAEAQAKIDLLIAQHRRSRVVGKANEARAQVQGSAQASTFNRMERKVVRADAVNKAHAEVLSSDTLEDRFAHLEREDEIERLLTEIKTRRKEA